MAKVELGSKRLCPNCGTKYYDLNKDPIVCPKCGTVFELSGGGRARPQTARAVEPEEEEEVEVVAPPDAELVSLEEADEEAAESGAVKTEAGEEEAEEGEAAEADDTFLEEEDEADDNVGDIIGGVEEEER